MKETIIKLINSGSPLDRKVGLELLAGEIEKLGIDKFSIKKSENQVFHLIDFLVPYNWSMNSRIPFGIINEQFSLNFGTPDVVYSKYGEDHYNYLKKYMED